MPICSCGFTIRGFLSAIQFLYVIVDKLCDIFIICTTKCYGFVDLHLFLKLVGFFCMYWCRWEKSHFIYNAILLAPKSSISDIYVVQLIQFYSLCFLHDWVNAECLAIHLKVQTMLINSFNAWKWKYSKNFSFVMHT